MQKYKLFFISFIVAFAYMWCVMSMRAQILRAQDCPPECEYCSVGELPNDLTNEFAKTWLQQCAKFCIDKVTPQDEKFGFSVGNTRFCGAHKFLSEYREIQTSQDYVAPVVWVCNETSKTLDLSVQVYSSCAGKQCGATCEIDREPIQQIFNNSGSGVLTDCRVTRSFQFLPGEAFPLAGSATAGYFVQNMNSPQYAATEIEIGLSPFVADSRVFTQTKIVTPCQTLTVTLQNVSAPMWSPNNKVSCHANNITLEKGVACATMHCNALDTSMSVGWLSTKNPIIKAQIANTSSNITWTQYMSIVYEIVLPGTYRKAGWISPVDLGFHSKVWREWEIAASNANYSQLYFDALQPTSYKECEIHVEYCTWFAKKFCNPLDTNIPKCEIRETGYTTGSISVSSIPDLCSSPITPTEEITDTLLPGGGTLGDPGGGTLGDRECFDIIKAQENISQTSFIPSVSLCVTWVTMPELKNLIPGIPQFLTIPSIIAVFIAFWYVKRLLAQFG